MGDGNKALTTAEELVNFMDSNDMLMHLSIKEAEVLLNYMEGHGYVLEDYNGKLIRTDLHSGENPGREEYSIDDAIDAVCEWNYELIQEAKQQREDPEDFLDFVTKDSHYQTLRKDEKILGQMFDRTRYGKEIMELTEKLVGEFIQNVEIHGNREEAAHPVSGGISGFSTDKKGKVR